jgi:hypothetical protein
MTAFEAFFLPYWVPPDSWDPDPEWARRQEWKMEHQRRMAYWYPPKKPVEKRAEKPEYNFVGDLAIFTLMYFTGPILGVVIFIILALCA